MDAGKVFMRRNSIKAFTGYFGKQVLGVLGITIPPPPRGEFFEKIIKTRNCHGFIKRAASLEKEYS
jgi:hypothetical protein